MNDAMCLQNMALAQRSMISADQVVHTPRNSIVSYSACQLSRVMDFLHFNQNLDTPLK